MAWPEIGTKPPGFACLAIAFFLALLKGLQTELILLFWGLLKQIQDQGFQERGAVDGAS